MSKFRRAAKVDANQKQIVTDLRTIPGVTVAVGHDDLLVGYRGHTFWLEIKNEKNLSKKTGQVRLSAVKESQQRLKESWTGHYQIVTSLNEILKEIGFTL